MLPFVQRQHPSPHIFMLQHQRDVHTPSEHPSTHGEVELQVERPRGHVHGLDEVFEAKWFSSFDGFEWLGFGVFGFFFVENFELDFVRVGVLGVVVGRDAQAVDVVEFSVADGCLAGAEGVDQGHDRQGMTAVQH